MEPALSHPFAIAIMIYCSCLRMFVVLT